VAGAPVTFEVAPGQGSFGNSDGKSFTAASSSGLVHGLFQAGNVPDDIQVTLRLGDFELPTTVTVVEDTTLASPRILAVQPDSAEVVSVNTSVGADFSKSVKPATITPASFRLRLSSDTLPLAGEFSFALDARRVVFTPESPLGYATSYAFDVSVGDTIRDSSENPVSNPTSVFFTTQAAPDSVTLHALHPQAGASGTLVTLVGAGFSGSPSENEVFFGPTKAPVLEANPAVLLTLVPADTLPGGTVSVYVVAESGGSNSLLFEVLDPITSPDFNGSDTVSVPVSGQEIVALPDSRAYITSAGANAILPLRYFPQIDPEDPIPVGLHPYGIAAAPSGRRVYVTNFFSNDVSVIDTDSSRASFQSVIESIPAGLNPTGLAVHPDGRSLYVANYGDATLTIIDTDSTHATYHLARATANTGADTRTIVITPDGGFVVMGTSTGLILLDPVTGDILETINLGVSTQSLAIHPAGGFVLVLATDGQLLLVDLRPGYSGFVRATANTGTDGRSIVISPDGGLVLVTLPEGFVLIFEIRILGGSGGSGDPSAAQYQFIGPDSVAVGENPFGMAFDPNDPSRLLVVNEGDQTVSILRDVTVATSTDETLILPTRFQVYPNFPNPFGLRTTIRYDLPRTSDVEVRIYDVAGRLVSVLKSRGEAAGRRTMLWDGRNSSGLQVASGIYFYEFRAGDFRDVRRMVRLR
jgi:YVTN family beta-propeller protein